VTDLLTIAQVRKHLGLTDSQLRRLADKKKMDDPLPVFHLNRKAPRVHPDDLEAWVTRRRLTAGIPCGYTPGHDWRGAATAAAAGGTLATGTRHETRNSLEHPGPDGAGRVGRARGGRPRSALRMLRAPTQEGRPIA
jgi:hypothetical protein